MPTPAFFVTQAGPKSVSSNDQVRSGRESQRAAVAGRTIAAAVGEPSVKALRYHGEVPGVEVLAKHPYLVARRREVLGEGVVLDLQVVGVHAAGVARLPRRVRRRLDVVEVHAGQQLAPRRAADGGVDEEV